MKRKCICILCGMLLLLVVSGCSLASPSPSSSPSSSSDFTTVLSKLGITVDSASNRIDSNGNAVDATVNPFGYKNTVVHKNCEIFISGIKYKNNYTSFLENKSYSVKGSDSDGAWANSYYNKSTAADIDGDGIDEVITIYYDSSKSSKKEIVFRELTKFFIS